MPKLSTFTKQLKKYALNPKVSDEEFLNALLQPFVNAGNIKNKNHEEIYISKSRTSELMSQKTDVPNALRKGLSRDGIKEKTIEGMIVFVKDYLDSTRYASLSKMLKDIFIAEKLESMAMEDTAEIQESLSVMLTELLMKSISESNLAEPEVVLIWKHGLNSIDAQSGDLFHFGFDNRSTKKNIIVIPVNTAFDSNVTRNLEGDEYPLVSENTIHGQWLIRMMRSGEKREEIDVRIGESLKRLGYTSVKKQEKSNGKKSCYPIGAVAIIENKNTVYFLIALSEFDDFNNAVSSSDDIDAAVDSLLSVYDRFGQGYDMYLPLMGTGLSRAGLSMQEAYDLLIKNLMENKVKIHGHIHLIIRPEDRIDIILQED